MRDTHIQLATMRCHSCHRRCARCMYVATAVTTAARVCMACICARICARVFVYRSEHSPSTARQPRRARTPRPAVATHPDTAPRSLVHAYSPGTSAGTCDLGKQDKRQKVPQTYRPPKPPKNPQKIAPRSGTFLCPSRWEVPVRWQSAATPTDTARADTRKSKTGLLSPHHNQI